MHHLQKCKRTTMPQDTSRKRKRSLDMAQAGRKVAKVPDDCVVIAVDFGTTFSGVAYSFNVPGKTPDVVSILDWPGEFLLSSQLPKCLLFLFAPRFPNCSLTVLKASRDFVSPRCRLSSFTTKKTQPSSSGVVRLIGARPLFESQAAARSRAAQTTLPPQLSQKGSQGTA